METKPETKSVSSANEVSSREASDATRARKYEALRQKMSRSRLSVKPPPGKTGYWARKDDEGELSRLDYLGFKIVHDDPKSPKWQANGFKQDGTYQIGDVVLLECDSDVYEFLLDENQRQADQLVSGAKESFLGEAEKYGVPTFEVNPEKGVKA